MLLDVSFKDLKSVIQKAGVGYSDDELLRALKGNGPIKCRFYTSRNLRKDQSCPYASWCNFRQEFPLDLRCALRLIEIAAEIRKRHWLEEI
jgi:hypothetical protein